MAPNKTIILSHLLVSHNGIHYLHKTQLANLTKPIAVDEYCLGVCGFPLEDTGKLGVYKVGCDDELEAARSLLLLKPDRNEDEPDDEDGDESTESGFRPDRDAIE